ncbi:MAG: LamG domain-containing protein [Actinomycetota bacterium]|nr:LamG domain-containing protein [Actinomycetota bacterium]
MTDISDRADERASDDAVNGPARHAGRRRWLPRVDGTTALLTMAMVWSVLLAVAGLTPRWLGEEADTGSSLPLWGHAVATAGISAMVSIAAARWRGRRSGPIPVAIVGFLGGFTWSVLVELLQLLDDERVADDIDLRWGIAGSVAGAVAATIAVTRWIRLELAARIVMIASVVVLVSGAVVAIAIPNDPGVVEACPAAPGLAADPVASAPLPSGAAERVTDGLVVRYDLEEGGGSSLVDSEGVGPPLRYHATGSPSWTDGAATFDGTGGFSSIDPADELAERMRRADAVTVEAWVRPANITQAGPTRIFSMSSGTQESAVDFHLGQELDAFALRLRTSCTLFEQTTTPPVATAGEVSHVVAVYEDGVASIWVDGELATRRALQPGDLSNWDDRFPLLIGDEATGQRSYEGDILLTALYERALAPAEIGRNLAAGPDG